MGVPEAPLIANFTVFASSCVRHFSTLGFLIFKTVPPTPLPETPQKMDYKCEITEEDPREEQ